MHVLLNKEYREQIAKSKYTYRPNRVVTFPRYIHERLLEVEREENSRRLKGFGKGYSKDFYRLMAFMVAMRIETEIDGKKAAFVCADSKKELGAMAGIKERNAQKIISKMIKKEFIKEYSYHNNNQIYNGYVICDYHLAFEKGNGGVFKLPDDVWTEDFWAIKKPAMKLYFQNLSELQAHSVHARSTAKIKTNRDMQKLLHYKSSGQHEAIINQLRPYMVVMEAQPPVKGVAAWLMSIHTIMDSIKKKQDKLIPSLPKISVRLKEETLALLDKYNVPGREEEKTLEDFCNALKKYGKERFEIGLRALLGKQDYIKTTPVQKLWGILKNMVADNLEDLKISYGMDKEYMDKGYNEELKFVTT